MSADSFVRHVALASLDAVVDADLADGTERFVVKSWNTQRGAQLLVELSKVLQMHCERWQFQSFIGKQKLLITSVPQPCELAFQHDSGSDGHLVEIVGALAKLGAAAIFFHTHHAARAAH